MKNLTKKELLEINGGWEWLDQAMFFSGYVAGSALDLVHGIWDGLMGTEKH